MRIAELEEVHGQLRECALMAAEDAAMHLMQKMQFRATHLWSTAHKEELQEQLVAQAKKHKQQCAVLESGLKLQQETAAVDAETARRFSETVQLQNEEMLQLRGSLLQHKLESESDKEMIHALQQEMAEWRELSFQLELKIDRLERECHETNTSKQCIERLLQSRTRQAETILRERDVLRSKLEKLERRNPERSPLTPRTSNPRATNGATKEISIEKAASVEDRALLALVRRLQQQLADTREQLRSCQQGSRSNVDPGLRR